jgi:hypothetical protein
MNRRMPRVLLSSAARVGGPFDFGESISSIESFTAPGST